MARDPHDPEDAPEAEATPTARQDPAESVVPGEVASAAGNPDDPATGTTADSAVGDVAVDAPRDHAGRDEAHEDAGAPDDDSTPDATDAPSPDRSEGKDGAEGAEVPDTTDAASEDTPAAGDPAPDDAPDDAPDQVAPAPSGTEHESVPESVPESGPEPETETPTATPAERTAAGAAPYGRHGSPGVPEPGGLRALGRALRPRANRSQVVVGVLCALLGFALVAQVSQTQEDQLSSLRQSDLVRLLDEVTQRSGELEDQVSSLEATRDELRSGTGRERAALEVAREQEQTQGILSGRLPAEGPGVEVEVVEGSTPLDAFSQFNVLEELRNAGAEAMEVNGVRLVASSSFEDGPDGIVVDGTTISSPFRWTVIGDPSTIETALEIPGGAMASLRSDGARTAITQRDSVTVGTTREPGTPQYATPVPADE
ncbi:DUF881 domain-containing protein [Cellulosimicrobium marinum]|uniref:DUF881 domain-containing protein n=1 Tax=Cellulosimicrobium marinum TaxID=1638992 RepID=UPI001E3C4A37|nr:DUF881 domain-containing protein [Cellulosimicrobium marinum]MCB7137539.1 DUF881 domain-containing protein [Cellulosimicrobium marinum]